VKYSYKKSAINNKLNNAAKKVKTFEWKHKNLIIFFVSVLVGYLIVKSPAIDRLLENLKNFGYVGAFAAGSLFTYAFTTVPASGIIFKMGRYLHPLPVAFIGAFGSVLSDYIIFHLVKTKLVDEIKLLTCEIKNLSKPISHLPFTKEITYLTWKKICRMKRFRILIPVVAGLIIASPLPDEIGVAIFGAAKFEPKKFIAMAYLLNFAGIFALCMWGGL